MSDYNALNIKSENLILMVTSTFGMGDPPGNGKVRILKENQA